jgi:uncharacterized membrane protein (DUF485 family)
VSSPYRKPDPVAFPQQDVRRTQAQARTTQTSTQEPAVPKPAAQEAHQIEWDRIAAKPEFKDLMATKKWFIVPAFVFFVVYYFLLPVLVGYAPAFMSTKVLGPVNLAYLFALSQFFMAWTIAFLYVKAANNFDKLAKDIIDNLSEDSAAKLANSRGGN